MTRTVAVTAVVALVLAATGLFAWPWVEQWRAGQETAAAQQELRTELDRAAPNRATPGARLRTADAIPHVATAADPGQALVEMTVPRFGEAWSWVVVEGTAPEQLERGPGHYAGSPLPGDRGNVAVAGHRAGHGDPFIDFDTLRPGDEVAFHRAGTTWTYRLTTGPEIIPVTADEVLDPLPGHALTLTTCWPRYGSSKRMYVRGTLVDVSDGAEASQARAQGS